MLSKNDLNSNNEYCYKFEGVLLFEETDTFLGLSENNSSLKEQQSYLKNAIKTSFELLTNDPKWRFASTESETNFSLTENE